ncbi:MAG TPA: YfcE family phosphodiesterase [Patescibacteria group bacterium]|nr:YfcE family phosphodiesterase [Patescibacteria group bacterium]
MVKIGVISDTHIPFSARQIPQKVIDDFKTVDMVMVAGDLAEMSVLKQLKSACPRVHAVWGNMDGPEVRAHLPEKEVITVGSHKIGLMHGYGHPDGLLAVMRAAFKDDGVDMIIFGHSHKPYNEKKDGILYFNPGSPTDTAFAPYNSYGMVEINDAINARIVKL